MGKTIAPPVHHAASSTMPFVLLVVSQQPYLSCLVKIVPFIVVIATRPSVPHAPPVSTATVAVVMVAVVMVAVAVAVNAVIITANATIAGKII